MIKFKKEMKTNWCVVFKDSEPIYVGDVNEFNGTQFHVGFSPFGCLLYGNQLLDCCLYNYKNKTWQLDDIEICFFEPEKS